MAIIVSSVVLAACGTETTNQTRVCDVIADAVDLLVDGDVTGATERVEDLAEMDTRGLDEELSLRHRRWGFNCPGVDLDLVMLEYHLSEPVALVEYKHHRAGAPNLTHPNYLAMGALAERAGVPLFVARYWPESWAMHVLPVTSLAEAALSKRDGRMTEQDYVRFLHHIRQVLVDDRVVEGLNTELPPPRLAVVR
jgi:hypothetical protein